MGMIVKGKKRVVEDEVFKLNQEDLEFLINIIKNSISTFSSLDISSSTTLVPPLLFIPML